MGWRNGMRWRTHGGCGDRPSAPCRRLAALFPAIPAPTPADPPTSDPDLPLTQLGDAAAASGALPRASDDLSAALLLRPGIEPPPPTNRWSVLHPVASFG